ncbi:MAG TPA: glycosyltransferase family 4 protein, partial [bacterium]
PFFIEWLNMKLAAKIITVSSALKQYYVQKKITPAKIAVVPNGVNTERFAPTIAGDSIRQKYHLHEKVVLGFVGSFHYWHGLENLMKLIEYTSSKYPQAGYLLVGDGPLKDQLQEFVASRHLERCVVLTGYVPHDDVPSYVAAMDIVLAPYPASDFFYFSPLKLFEYMAAGKAVLASDIGQISEIIQDEHNGLLYDPVKVDELFEKASALVENLELRNRLARNGRSKMVACYSWENNARNVATVLESALSLN